MSSWLPQNIQKRVFRYILDKLAVFSSLNLDDVDVQLGTTKSHLSLQNVRLDPDRLSIPGLYTRDGKINKLDISLAVTSGVNIVGSGVELTIALVSKTFHEDELSDLLGRTTADLAQSVMHTNHPNQPNSGDSDSGDESISTDDIGDAGNRGYGLGDFSSVVSKIADASISQLNIRLNNISVHIILNENTTVSCDIGSIQFHTDSENKRHIEIKDLSFYIWQDDEVINDNDISLVLNNPPGSPEPIDFDSDDESYDEDDDINGIGQSLAQSTIFQKSTYLDQSESLYMSAVAEHPPEPEPERRKVVFLSCDSLNTSFESMNLSCLHLQIGKVFLSMFSSCSVVVSLWNIFNTAANSEPQKADDNDPKTDQSKQIAVSRVSIDCLEVLMDSKNGEFDSQKLILRALSTNVDVRSVGESLITVQSLALMKDDTSIFKYADDDSDDSDDSDDITVHLNDGAVKVLIPKVAHLNAHIDDINTILDSVYSIIELLRMVKPNSTATKTSSNYAGNPNASSSLYVRTNTIFISITGGITSISSTVFPIVFKDGTGNLEKISFQLSYTDDDQRTVSSSVSLNGLVLSTKPYEGRSLSENTPVVIETELEINSAELSLDHRVLDALKYDLRSFHRRPMVHASFSGHTQQQEPTNHGRKVRIEEDTASLRASIRKVESTLSLPTIGLISVGLRDVAVQVNSRKNETDISIQRVSASKDFSEVDGSGIQPLIHVANPLELNRGMVLIGLENGEIKDIKLFNATFEYHVRLIKLFEQQQQGAVTRKNKGLDQSNSTVKDQAELRFPVFFLDCCIGLTPYNVPSKALFILRDGSTVVQKHTDGLISLELVFMRATLLLIDDLKNVSIPTTIGSRRSSSDDLTTGGGVGGGSSSSISHRFDPVVYFKKQGYVSVATLSSSRLWLGISHIGHLKLSSEMITLETCADSTQILMLTINGLKPPFEVSKEVKYHTEIEPVDVMRDVAEAAFSEETPGFGSSVSYMTKSLSNSSDEDLVPDDLPTNMEFVESYYGGSRFGTTSIGGRSKMSNGLSSSSTSSSKGLRYSMADMLLDQDLSTLVTGPKSDETNNDGSDSNALFSSHSSSQKIAVFEQRVQSLDSSLRFEDDYIPLPESEDRSPNAALLVDGDDDESEEKEPIFVIDLEESRIVWNLYDGYDWTYTQDTITNVVKKVEVEAAEVRRDKLSRSQNLSQRGEYQDGLEDHYQDDEREELVGDILFNSIYIGVPSGDDPKNLRRVINREINDDVSDTTYSGTARTGSAHGGNRTGSDSARQAGVLRLKRSKNFKIRVELTGITAKIVVIQGLDTPVVGRGKDGMVLNKIDLRVKDMEIIDNVPTSTWNKFVTYMRTAGPREMDIPILGVSIQNVRPLISAAVSEMIMSVSILPLRLHIDQDTLDFLTRFFEFRDDRFISQISPEVAEEDVFIQKADINEFRIKLDYKPKKVDYAGLKSGHTTEFMNFFILDEADIVLKHATVHGVTGFPRLVNMLNDIWLPDIRSNQLGEVLSGLAPVRSLVKIGSGMRDLVVVPLREYQRDRRVVPGLQKGAWSFAKNTTNELVKLGAKLAAGTQAILESAEQAMGGVGTEGRNPSAGSRRARYVSPYSDEIDDYAQGDSDEDTRTISSIRHSPGYSTNAAVNAPEKRATSLYADQPTSLNQGLRDAYRSLGKNLKMAREAVGDIPNDAAERGNAQGAAVAVMKAAPVAVIRPMIGATEAVSKTLLGVTNQLDPEQKAEVSDKYKPTRR